MEAKKRIIKNIAKNHNVDVDHFLVALWDSDWFQYILDENSLIRNNDYFKIKEIIESIKNKKEVEKIEDDSNKVKIIYKDFDFNSIGKINDQIFYITKDEILTIYNELKIDFDNTGDPIQPAGVRDEDLLESALFHPQTSYCKKRKYPTIESAAAALMYSISQDHPFHNGNKRTSIVAMLVFLDRHNFHFEFNEDDLFRISIKVADHKIVDPEYLYADAEIFALARWIHSNGRLEERGERLITFKRLRQILSHFNCIILDNGKIERDVPYTFWGINREKKLYSRQLKSNMIVDGEEIDRGILKSIREDLELDLAHNIDSKTFYEQMGFTSSEFINKYKGLIKRLSKL